METQHFSIIDAIDNKDAREHVEQMVVSAVLVLDVLERFRGIELFDRTPLVSVRKSGKQLYRGDEPVPGTEYRVKVAYRLIVEKTHAFDAFAIGIQMPQLGVLVCDLTIAHRNDDQRIRVSGYGQPEFELRFQGEDDKRQHPVAALFYDNTGGFELQPATYSRLLSRIDAFTQERHQVLAFEALIKEAREHRKRPCRLCGRSTRMRVKPSVDLGATGDPVCAECLE